ncbi:immunoglobulin-like and fibronectin type III domain-containing protein 1 [Scleropages formosus]|uniref:immunoglobulin-like and fibronectin type III domain-containing protein 1 n=1 Tax=Scleropages formosus TaxID=113540 RepID=UPI0010FAA36D|nr:immunoglobulin-like and fibronectin type III domain-containing protein 1 [Scleropages formosus]
MITQYVEQLPKGKSAPDITRKPVSLTINEGKMAIFRTVVTGDPTPTVTWRRNNGDLTDPEKYHAKYDDRTGENILEIPNVSVDEADTYKCFATNEFGKATCNVILNVTEVGIKKKKATDQGLEMDFRKMLKKTTVSKKKPPPKKEGEVDPQFWELLLSADRKDYERICLEHGFTDFRFMLKKLNQLKKEREEEQAKYVENITNLKPIEIKRDGRAEFEFDMELKDPNSNIFLFKDGEMIDYGKDNEMKHNMTKMDKRYTFSIKDLEPEDAGLYQVDVENTNIFSTELKIPPVEFLVEMKDVKAVEGEDSVFDCTLSCPLPSITWMRNSTCLEAGTKYDIIVSEDQLKHKLVVKSTKALDKGTYTALAGIRSSSASLIVEDHGAHFARGLSDVSALIGQPAEMVCMLSNEKCNGVWYKDGKKLKPTDGVVVTKDGRYCKLTIKNCKESDSGKYRFETDGGKTEAVLNVRDPPKFDSKDLGKFSEPAMVRAGENAIFKMCFAGRKPLKVQWYKDGDELLDDPNIKVETTSTHSCLLLSKCQRKDSGEIKIKIKNEFGTTEALSKLLVLAFPNSPAAPKVVSAFKDCINLSWTAPTNSGGSYILGYHLEKRKKGSNVWTSINPVDEPIKDKKYAVSDVVEGTEYEFRVTAVSASGPGEPSAPSHLVVARDPTKYPGKITDLKVIDSTNTSLTLSWNKPTVEKGLQDEAKGYFVEMRPAESSRWVRCNTNPITMTSYTVKGLKSMAMYWVRVIPMNEGGEGEPQELDKYILVMPPPVRPDIKKTKEENFKVIRVGNTVRINVTFTASPFPDIIWLKDGVPVSKRVTISNTEGTSQLLIPTSERSDTGIYTVIVKNLFGQETISFDIRVTDDPKSPGPVTLEQNVPGTVTLSWASSPDESLDNRLHYMVCVRDTSKRGWQTLADRLFNNKFTVTNITPGHEYQFRVYAKNDIGFSEPSKSSPWGTKKKKDKFKVDVPEMKAIKFQTPPTFLVPLKMHSAPQGYECHMSCAVRGNPVPHVTWYHNNISLNTNTNYYITNTCGVCSMVILRVGPSDNGEYKVIAENPLGRAECSAMLTLRE